MADPRCGFVFDGLECGRRGEHRCKPRVAHVVAFFTELLHHTKGDRARQKFVPADWQVVEVLAPLFGQMRYDRGRGRYVRRYRELYLLLARKNGKSALIAGIVLYMLCADGEDAVEAYGMAMDRDQAGFVYDHAARMVSLSPTLRQRLQVIRSSGRIVDESSDSYFVTLAGDDQGALGANPHVAYVDELLTQPSRDLYDAIRTGMGSRAQPLLMLATTAENDPSSFAAHEREYSLRCAADPDFDPQRLVVIHQADDADDWEDEATWAKANPALGDFLDIEVLRAEHRKAKNDPAAQRSFRQFRLNLPVGAVGRAIDLAAWDAGAGMIVESQLQGRRVFGGLDLASTIDLAALAWVFPDPPGETEDSLFGAVWRLWAPSDRLPDLDRRTAGNATVWVRSGVLRLTEGNVIDYEAIWRTVDEDARFFDVVEVAFDRWGATQMAQQLTDGGLRMVPFGQGFASMSAPTKELLRLVAAGRFRHGGNPAVRWMASNLTTVADPAGNLKPDKSRGPDSIDGMVAAVMALDRAQRWTAPVPKRRRAAGF